MAISKSITVNCEATIGGNTVPGGAALGKITISGLAATDVVILRGLDLDGGNSNPGGDMIFFNTTGTLRLEKMKISGVHGFSNGVEFNPSGTAKLHVSDSIVANNGTGSGVFAGIRIKPGLNAQTTVMIERSVIDNNEFGIFADGTAGGPIRGVVKDSVVSGNINNGISVNSGGTNVGLLVDNTLVSGNNIGLAAGGTNGLILVRRTAITANNTGLSAGGGGSLVSYQDNSLKSNSADGAFTATIGTQ
jgi:hypothetical protein